jgi:hypothetical protein
MMNPIAMAVARRVCGAALLADQVDRVGAERYIPGIEKKREAYWIWWMGDTSGVIRKRREYSRSQDDVPRNIANPMVQRTNENMQMKPRQWNRSET